VVALSPADVRQAAELFQVREAKMHVPHRQDATYHHNYTGKFVGANREAPPPAAAAAASTASSSSSSNASTPAPKSKGKGQAADRQ